MGLVSHENKRKLNSDARISMLVIVYVPPQRHLYLQGTRSRRVGLGLPGRPSERRPGGVEDPVVESFEGEGYRTAL